jgi:hypothetical protein
MASSRPLPFLDFAARERPDCADPARRVLLEVRDLDPRAPVLRALLPFKLERRPFFALRGLAMACLVPKVVGSGKLHVSCHGGAETAQHPSTATASRTVEFLDAVAIIACGHAPLDRSRLLRGCGARHRTCSDSRHQTLLPYPWSCQRTDAAARSSSKCVRPSIAAERH